MTKGFWDFMSDWMHSKFIYITIEDYKKKSKVIDADFDVIEDFKLIEEITKRIEKKP